MTVAYYIIGRITTSPFWATGRSLIEWRPDITNVQIIEMDKLIE